MSTNNFPIIWDSEADDGLFGSLFGENLSNLSNGNTIPDESFFLESSSEDGLAFPVEITSKQEFITDPALYTIVGSTFNYQQDAKTAEAFFSDTFNVDKNGFHLHYTKNSRSLFLLHIGFSLLAYLNNKLTKDKSEIYKKIFDFCKSQDLQFPFSLYDVQTNFDKKIDDFNFLEENIVTENQKIYATKVTALKYILKNPNDQKSIDMLSKISILIAKMDIEAQASFSEISNIEANPYENFLVGKKESFTYSDLQKLFLQLNQMQDSVKKIKVADFKTASEFVAFSNRFFVAKNDTSKSLIPYPFINIGIEQRKKLLNLFADENKSIETKWLVDSDVGSAELMLALLYCCKEDERLEIILEFEKNNTLYKLFSLSYYDCYNKLAMLVGNTYLKSIESQKEELTNKAIEDGNTIYFNTKLFGTHNIESFDDKEKKITFEIKENLLLELAQKVDIISKIYSVSRDLKNWIEGKNDTFENSSVKKSYNPLDLIVLTPIVDVEYAGTAFSKGEPYLMPACLAYYFFKEETKDVALTVFNISFQIALCFIGVGAVATAIRAGSIAAAVLGVTDIAVGVGGVVINSVPEIEKDHPDFVKYYNYFTWIYTVTRIVGSAGKVFRDRRKALKNENSGKYFIKSFLESEALTAEKLAEWELKIKTVSFNKCRFRVATGNKAVLRYMDKEESLAFFDANEIPPIIWYKENTTEYVISHEYFHLEEFTKIGKKNFLKGINGSLEEILVNDLLREKYVFEKIIENSSKFSQAELKHAKDYYFRFLRKIAENGFEVKPEYIVKFKL